MQQSFSGRTVPTGTSGPPLQPRTSSINTVGANSPSLYSNNNSYLARSNPSSANSAANSRVPSSNYGNISSNNRASNNNSYNQRAANENIRKKNLLEIDYIEQDDLNLLNLANFEIVENKATNETLLIDPRSPNEQFVILSKGWIDSEESPYIAEENVDLSSLKIFRDENNNRRYVIDDSTGNRYFLVSLERMKIKRNNLLRLNKRVDSMEKIDDSAQVIHFKFDENGRDDSEQFLGYVEEDDLSEIDLGPNGESIIDQDLNTGEIYLANRNMPAKRWIVLPQNWQIEETSPYLDEEDVQDAKFDIYVDSLTNRKYIIDDKTGQRYYLIPPVANNFRNDWANIQKIAKQRQNEKKKNNLLVNPNSERLAFFRCLMYYFRLEIKQVYYYLKIKTLKQTIAFKFKRPAATAEKSGYQRARQAWSSDPITT
jgi:hypothetical protein